MRIDVVGRHLQISDDVRAYAEHKARKLTRFSDQIQQITVNLDGQDHHHSGEVEAELVIDVEHHDDFVARAREREPRAAIDAVIQKGVRLMTDFNEKLKTEKR